LAKQIHLVGAVPYEEVLSYYRDAVLFVFPSYLETFGHPLLEAMAADLPVVAADIPVFREIAGDAALYVDPFDAEAIADGMERVLSDPDLGAGLVESARQRANDFTWKIAARRLGALLDEVIREA
jgi:glycosyltransferase involved in cell wall biosynthesis